MRFEDFVQTISNITLADPERDATIMKRLVKPKGSVDVVLDSDTYNEIDDQFALAYLIKSDYKLKLKAIYAAPFYNQKSSSPKEGMDLSFNEILRVLSLMKRDDLKPIVFKGSERYLASEKEAVFSEAANHLAKLAMNYTADSPLYVIAIGAITNIASALLLAPDIMERIVIIWLGGNALDWPHNAEFNLFQDVAASRIVFGCGVPLVQLPCMGVVSAFTTCGPELDYWLRGKNELCDYLVNIACKEAALDSGLPTWTRAIWDVAAVAWLLDGEFMLDRFEHSPIPEYDGFYAFDKTRHPIRYVYNINRDALIDNLFTTLTK